MCTSEPFRVLTIWITMVILELIQARRVNIWLVQSAKKLTVAERSISLESSFAQVAPRALHKGSPK